ncbi:hypothetical protein [Sporosarcina koreensis]|uniref:Uncharacterized protein n=1 Tax=Sporosarcina koreensis TaxID=334735 RepID=A0ABW0TWZ6_9BACL
MRYMTVDRAREEIQRLQRYVDLVESYEADTLEKFIIKKYALTGSLDKTLDLVHVFEFGDHIEKEDLVAVIRQRGKDELHKTVRSWYMQRTRAIRRK